MPALFGVVMAALVPGISYYGALAATSAALGIAVGTITGNRWPAWYVVALTAGALPGTVLWSIGGRAHVSALGVGGSFVGVVFFAMATLTALPLLAMTSSQDEGAWLGGRESVRVGSRLRALVAPASMITATLVLTMAGLVVDRFDEAHPETAFLMYVPDANTDAALWASVEDDPHDWAASYVPDTRRDDPITVPLPSRVNIVRTGAAEPIPVAEPDLTLLDSHTEDGFTIVRLRARSHRDAYALSVHADRPVREATLRVAGHPPVHLPALDPNAGGSSAWPWEVQFFDPPADGIEITLRLRGTRAPRIGITDWTNGLDGLPGYTGRPPNVDMAPAGPPTDSVVVTRVYQPQ